MYRTERRRDPTSTADDRLWPTHRRRQRRRPSRYGAAAIEYCLLLSFISIAGIGAVQNIGLDTKGVFSSVSSSLGGDTSSGGGGQGGDQGNGDAKGKGKGKGKGKAKSK